MAKKDWIQTIKAKPGEYILKCQNCGTRNALRPGDMLRCCGKTVILRIRNEDFGVQKPYVTTVHPDLVTKLQTAGPKTMCAYAQNDPDEWFIATGKEAGNIESTARARPRSWEAWSDGTTNDGQDREDAWTQQT